MVLVAVAGMAEICVFLGKLRRMRPMGFSTPAFRRSKWHKAGRHSLMQ